jgi:hypothetical protein
VRETLGKLASWPSGTGREPQLRYLAVTRCWRGLEAPNRALAPPGPGNLREGSAGVHAAVLGNGENDRGCLSGSTNRLDPENVLIPKIRHALDSEHLPYIEKEKLRGGLRLTLLTCVVRPNGHPGLAIGVVSGQNTYTLATNWYFKCDDIKGVEETATFDLRWFMICDTACGRRPARPYGRSHCAVPASRYPFWHARPSDCLCGLFWLGIRAFLVEAASCLCSDYVRKGALERRENTIRFLARLNFPSRPL